MARNEEGYAEWCVISCTMPEGNFLVTLDPHDDRKYYWGGGASWSMFHQDEEIIHSYGLIADDDFDKLDEIEADYYQNYVGVKPELKPSAGWLSPEGNFYPCSYGNHVPYADTLAGCIYGHVGRAMDFLGDMGWGQIGDSGIYSFVGTRPPTVKQKETVEKLIEMAGKNSLYGDYLKAGLKKIKRKLSGGNKDEI